MAIEASSQHNKAKLMSSASENSWQWYDWKGFFKSTFRAVLGIAKNHHFHFSSTFPGIVKVKKSVDDEEKDIRLVKRGKHIPECLPAPVEPQGLSPTRAWYLYRQIRPFVRGPHKDDLCPVPSADEVQTGANVTEE
ncbi:uncharacterized protein LOC117333839 [Pecten maximus]|uniref:uncharacterized protein LOC117333839 n=1 Tax=Pecten maximus TaxID=6579 RepID=UPI0014586840|nr:uncharacterized protein LOC117333839 [Pecten maximus]